MVNLLWLAFFLGGILVAAFKGQGGTVSAAIFQAAQTSVRLAFDLAGFMAFWLGILRVAEEAGLVDLLARLLRPLMRYLFPEVPPAHPALGAILMNLGASCLGLGNAATPFGLKAMRELQELNPCKEEASAAMCTFLALNTACVTLVPATIIGIRAAAGSQNPAEIILPTFLATLTATFFALLADRLFRRLMR